MTGIFETGLQVVYNYSDKNNHIRESIGNTSL